MASEDVTGVGSKVFYEHVGFCEIIIGGSIFFGWDFVEGWFNA